MVGHLSAAPAPTELRSLDTQKETQIMKIAHVLPEMIKPSLRHIWRSIKHIPNWGINRYCPVCKISSKRFAEFGIVPRKDAICKYCGAIERDRLLWLYFNEKTDLFNKQPKKMLHVAPEPAFEDLLRKHLGAGYLTADLYSPRVMVKMDITDIQYPNETFDVIYCSHVLEHVPDDKRALREFYRVLKSNGWAILLVPITTDRTLEDMSITDPSDRLRIFGQEDHVRRYGPDYMERLKEAGFKVEVTTPSQFLSEEQISRMAITKAAGEIYYCTKK